MKTAVLILALLWVPLVIGGTVAAMIFSLRHRATRPQGLREFAVVGTLVVAVAFLLPLLLLLRVI